MKLKVKTYISAKTNIVYVKCVVKIQFILEEEELFIEGWEERIQVDNQFNLFIK